MVQGGREEVQPEDMAAPLAAAPVIPDHRLLAELVYAVVRPGRHIAAGAESGVQEEPAAITVAEAAAPAASLQEAAEVAQVGAQLR